MKNATDFLSGSDYVNTNGNGYLEFLISDKFCFIFL